MPATLQATQRMLYTQSTAANDLQMSQLVFTRNLAIANRSCSSSYTSPISRIQQ